MSDPRKKSFYLKSGQYEEMVAESKRIDRPVSWLIQYLWTHFKDQLKDIPTLR
jgi:hypothetical protein